MEIIENIIDGLFRYNPPFPRSFKIGCSYFLFFFQNEKKIVMVGIEDDIDFYIGKFFLVYGIFTKEKDKNNIVVHMYMNFF